jgi:hypothetical protein
MLSSARHFAQQLPIVLLSPKHHNHNKQLAISAVLQISVTKIKPYDSSYDLIHESILFTRFPSILRLP